MKKLLLGLALSVSVVMASDMPKDDLLSMATMGKTTGSQFEMSKSEMKDADGGYYSFRTTYGSYYRSRSYSRYYSNPSSSRYRGTSRSYIYARAWNKYN